MNSLSLNPVSTTSALPAAALSFSQDPKPSPPKSSVDMNKNVEYSGKPNKKLSFDEIDGDKYAQKIKGYFGVEYKNCKKNGKLTAGELAAYMIWEIHKDLAGKENIQPDRVKYATADQLNAFAETSGWNISELISETNISAKSTKDSELWNKSFMRFKDDLISNKIDLDKVAKVAVGDMEKSHTRVYPKHRPDGVLSRDEAVPIAFSPVSRETAAYIKDATSANFEADVIETSRHTPVLVEFGAPWCLPCHFITPVLEKLTVAAKGRFLLVKLNVDKAEKITKNYGVKAFPTVMLFKDGQPVGNFTGIKSESEVQQFIDDKLSASPKAP